MAGDLTPRSRRPFEAVACLGSFLLFQIEVIVSRLLLPSFGGAAYVWTTCMMFFQGVLLLGYLYCRAVLSRFPAGRYARFHLLLTLLPLFFFPVAVRVAGASPTPVLQLLGLLSSSIGLPFLVLSTTSPMIQSWMRRSGFPDPVDSYSVYAASNAGALAALLSYPLLFEPFLTLNAQLSLWYGGYALYALLHIFCLPEKSANAEALPGKVRTGDALVWTLLALGPSASLLAATNLLTLDFAAVPLLWIIPLALYLGTLILVFKRTPWYPQLGMAVVYAMIVWALCVLLTVLYSADVPGEWHALRRLWVVNKFLFMNAALFIVCLICHRALAQSKPPAARSPQFYVSVALGGWLGSVVIGVLMPWLGRHTAMPELDWAIAGGLAFGALILRDRLRGRFELKRAGAGLAAVAAFAAAGFAFYASRSLAFAEGVVESRRNFYGFLKVVSSGGIRRFYHGNTLHGLQYVDPSKQDIPLLYYHERSPFGELMGAYSGSLKRIGVAGLGIGVIAAYGRPGQELDFYELDPDVESAARAHFTYLSRSRATVRVAAGDGRLLIQGYSGKPYDMLILDAFTGGAIPVHMLTREALDLYLHRTVPDGYVVFHITNRFLNLRPVLAALAGEAGLSGVAKMTDPSRVTGEKVYYSSWVVMSRDPKKLEALKRQGWSDLKDFARGVRPWTDQYANLWAALAS